MNPSNQDQWYIGTKVVQAFPAEQDGQPGYRVIYEDGYKSWSPKAVFEEAYQHVLHDHTPGDLIKPVLPDIKVLSLAASQAVAQQLVIGGTQNYTDWDKCDYTYLIGKMLVAIVRGNWRSALAWGTFILVKDQREFDANSKASPAKQ